MAKRESRVEVLIELSVTDGRLTTYVLSSAVKRSCREVLSRVLGANAAADGPTNAANSISSSIWWLFVLSSMAGAGTFFPQTNRLDTQPTMLVSALEIHNSHHLMVRRLKYRRLLSWTMVASKQQTASLVLAGNRFCFDTQLI